MSIEGIALGHFSELPKADNNSTTPSHQRHAVFHSFLSDYIKQDAATTTSSRKHLISLLKEKKITTTPLSTMVVWNNMGVDFL